MSKWSPLILLIQMGSVFVHKLSPINALGGNAPQVDKIGQLTLTENNNLALASVSARLGNEKACHKHLKALIGDIPGPGRCQLSDPISGYWISPDSWMIIAPHDTHEHLASDLKARFAETASITEQTDGWCCFDMCGETLERLIERLCNINIREMRSGDAYRTSIEHLSCFVLRCDPIDQVRIFGPRSSAGSLHHALVTIMKAIA